MKGFLIFTKKYRLFHFFSSLKGPCPSGWMHFKSGYCYFVSSAIKTWHKAQAYCKRLGGELVNINSNEENEFVLKLVHEHEPSLKQVWIGLKWVTSQFIWSDDSVPNYTKWASGEPNGKASEPCSNMWIKHLTAPGINGYWNDLSCWHPAYPCGIVCKRLP